MRHGDISSSKDCVGVAVVNYKMPVYSVQDISAPVDTHPQWPRDSAARYRTRVAIARRDQQCYGIDLTADLLTGGAPWAMTNFGDPDSMFECPDPVQNRSSAATGTRLVFAE